MKLVKGKRYNLGNLEFVGWSVGELFLPQMTCWTYFDGGGRYLGPDDDGVEPLFDLTSTCAFCEV